MLLLLPAVAVSSGVALLVLMMATLGVGCVGVRQRVRMNGGCRNVRRITQILHYNRVCEFHITDTPISLPLSLSLSLFRC